MWDYISLYFYTGDVAWRAVSNRHENMQFNLNPSFSLKWGGMWQHLSGRQFILLNGSILAMDLRCYNEKNLKSHLRIRNIDSWSDGWDLAMLSLHAITWCNLDALMKIWCSRLNHKDSPLWTPLRLLISSRRRSDSHAQFQNIINSLSLMGNVFLDVSSYRII